MIKYLIISLSITLGLSQQEIVDRIDTFLGETQKKFEVPGVSVAIVKDNKIIFAKGYGVQSLSKKNPVDENSIYAIGSTTKAFTAAALGKLVESGKIDWDDRVIDHIPEFELHDPSITNMFTIRDLLTHRSGLPRGDLLWYATDFSRQEIIERVRHLEPTYSFRAGFGYQNIMYLTAGEIIPRVTGKSWDDYIQEIFFKPLRMKRTSSVLSDLKRFKNVATPHQEIDGEVKEIPWRNIDNVGPAGSINSSVSDMANWAMMLLNEGSFNGKQVLKPETINELFMPQQIMRKEGRLGSYYPPVQFLTYGLGWFVSDFNGYKMIEHGGNIDGMHAQISLVPELELGIVFLSNQRNLMPEASRYYIVEEFALIDHETDWSAHFLKLINQADSITEKALEEVMQARDFNSEPSLPLKEYTGIYSNPMYGEVSVKLRGKSLRIEGHRQFEGNSTHWHHDSFEVSWDQARLGKIIITFELDVMGNVKGVEIPGKGFHSRQN